MPNGPRPLLDNACYHIITRGNQRQCVFESSDDFQEYLSLIKKYKRRYKFKVYEYCLMEHCDFNGVSKRRDI